MKDVTVQQMYNIAASLLKDRGLPEPRSIWNWQDVFAPDFIDKGTYSNLTQVTIYLKIEGKELFSFRIEAVDEAEYRKKLNHIITTDLRFIQ
jgi:hypothetical protein